MRNLINFVWDVSAICTAKFHFYLVASMLAAVLMYVLKPKFGECT